jgi:alkylation response protein AidB-like acyl-CoA dehydrogenase
MNPGFSAEEERFRAEVREFLADWNDLDAYFLQGHRWERVKAFFRAMGQRGWLSLTWPREWGGLARPISWEYVLWDEVGRARVARNPLGPGIVAKTILRHGSEGQKRRWLPAIRSGEAHFSLGYSEPQAGSDLASLRCRAEPAAEGGYVVTGEKCWQSYAQDMDHLWLLVRTGSQESRGDGLTLLIVDLDAPGVTLGPLPTLDGDQLNEIRLEAVVVGPERRVGPENGAWKIMAEALADERHIQFPPGRVQRDLGEIVAWARARGLDGDPTVRRTLAELFVEALEVEVHALRVLDAMQKGRPAAVEAAASKIAHTLACQKIARTAFEWGGPEPLCQDSPVQILWLQSLWETIGGGTSEIMRGIVARQRLGLASRR